MKRTPKLIAERSAGRVFSGNSAEFPLCPTRCNNRIAFTETHAGRKSIEYRDVLPNHLYVAIWRQCWFGNVFAPVRRAKLAPAAQTQAVISGQPAFLFELHYRLPTGDSDFA